MRRAPFVWSNSMRPASLLVGIALIVATTSVRAQVPRPPGHELIVPDSAAKDHLDEMVTVEGTVVSIEVSEAAPARVFLHFGAPAPNQTFSALIVGPVLPRFPNLQEWRGKRVRVTGLVRLEEGRPTIRLTKPSQLRGAAWYVFPAPGTGG